MREHRVPTIVVHGENDLVVPFESARDMADRADATLYKVPGAYHSWMLANPRQGADMMRQLLDAELGDVLRESEASQDGWRDTLLTADSTLRAIDEPLDLGVEETDPVELDRLRVSTSRVAPSVAPAKRRRRWFATWRRTGRRQASPGLADTA
jgi:hypothetical protein